MNISQRYRKLPDDIENLILEFNAPPRLIAHLTLVHDVSWELTDMLNKQFPNLTFDGERNLNLSR